MKNAYSYLILVAFVAILTIVIASYAGRVITKAYDDINIRISEIMVP